MTFAARHPVKLWTREEEVSRCLQETRENARYFPGHRLPDAVQIVADFTQAVSDADLLILATPLIGFRPTLKQLRHTGLLRPLVWVCKGLEAETARLPHQIVAEEIGPDIPCAALSGPSFAEEVARGLPTAITLASRNAEFARETALELHRPHLRIYANDDLPGVEVGGAVKNVMAIATGLCDGLHYGLNARAALMTRGLAEIARLAQHLGAQEHTLMGLSGLGDLILTCTGGLSRNRQVGLKLAENKDLDTILAELGHVAEGVYTVSEAQRLAQQYQVSMPITETLYALFQGQLSSAQVAQALMMRSPTSENS